MVSRHLILKLYLWLLLALTLSVAGAVAAFSVLSERDFDAHLREWVLAEVRPARDVVQNLLRSGLEPEQVRAVLAPLRHTARITLRIYAADGHAVLTLPARPPEGREPPDEARERPEERRPWPPPDPGTVRRALAGEEVLEWHHRNLVVAALPIVLPDGSRGAFHVTARRFRWQGEGFSWRLLAGLGAVLVTLWLLSWPLAAHLARPLKRMARAADALGRGDFSVRIGPEAVHHWGHRHGWRRRDEIGRLAASFNRMAENLERLLLGHKQLLADISHELRSPLARLRLALELARDARGEEQTRYLDTLERQADTMEDMIGELLFFARLDESPYALRPEPVVPGALVQAGLEAQRPDADARRVTLTAAVADGLPTLQADRRLLERALDNALRNAIAYSPEGGTVTVSARREGARLLITVRDEGPGVPPELLERIFEPFVRADAARSRSTGGVGLGLAIVRRCMEAHGGGAQAAPGPDERGLALTLWLPLPAAA